MHERGCPHWLMYTIQTHEQPNSIEVYKNLWISWVRRDSMRFHMIWNWMNLLLRNCIRLFMSVLAIWIPWCIDSSAELVFVYQFPSHICMQSENHIYKLQQPISMITSISHPLFHRMKKKLTKKTKTIQLSYSYNRCSPRAKHTTTCQIIMRCTQ